MPRSIDQRKARGALINFVAMVFQRIVRYLDPRWSSKKTASGPEHRAMHSMNRISIVVFLIAVLVLAVRWATRP